MHLLVGIIMICRQFDFVQVIFLVWTKLDCFLKVVKEQKFHSVFRFMSDQVGLIQIHPLISYIIIQALFSQLNSDGESMDEGEEVDDEIPTFDAASMNSRRNKKGRYIKVVFVLCFKKCVCLSQQFSNIWYCY